MTKVIKTSLLILMVLWYLCLSPSLSLVNGFSPEKKVEVETGGLQRNGENVCELRKDITVPYKTVQVSHVKESRNEKCGWFGWSRCNRERTNTKTMYVIRTRPAEKIVLYCCDGWKRRNKVCDIPYCNPGCKEGTCIGGHKCKCSNGWRGDLCDQDINECHENANCEQVCTNVPGSFICGCDKGYENVTPHSHQCKDIDECNLNTSCQCANQNSVGCNAKCINTVGSFRCSCGKGFRLVSSAVCQDIDECLSSQTNNCPIKCINTPGSFSCDCMRGFRKVGSGCKDINECETANGGCQHRCINAYGTYICRCKHGFRLLNNKMRCKDINECKLFHGCEMKCVNTQGSYYCSCPEGYSLNEDQHTCADINECSLQKVKGLEGNTSLSDCEQQCINTVGSFKCSCKRGFVLKSDGKACKDTNECILGTHKCAHDCHNTIGSYVCTCRPGYILGPDKKLCKRLPCASIEPPHHGSMDCTGFGTGQHCNFKCDPGYRHLGSIKRTCLPSSKWNGTIATCKAKSCPKLKAPENAEIILPCYKTFKSKCRLQCMSGYFSNENAIGTCDVDKSTNLAWQIKELKCEKIQICDPNPCLNGGKCLVQGWYYVCDCEGTGYEGGNCQTGILRTPTFEKLQVNEESKPLFLHAKPKNELLVTIKSTQAIIVKPKRELRISKSLQKVQFTIIPIRAGFHEISYSLTGEDAQNFKVPKNNTLYVEIKGKTHSIYKQLKIETGALPLGCHDYSPPNKILQCKGHLISTHLWSSNEEPDSRGIVHVKVGNVTLPVSLFGTDAMAIPPARKELLDKIQRLSSRSMDISISLNKNGKCEVFPVTSTSFLELIQTDAFPKAFFSSFSRLMPKWIHFNIDKSNNLFDISNLIVNIGRPPSGDQNICEHLPLPFSGKVFFKPAIAFQTTIDGETKAFGANERACFAVDACNSTAYVAFSPEARKRIMRIKILQKMRTAGWDFLVSSIGFRKNNLVDAKEHSFDMWINEKVKIDLHDSYLTVKTNISGEIEIQSTHFEELLAKQFTHQITGKAKGKFSLKAILRLQSSKNLQLKFNSDYANGKFTFGGKDNLLLKRLPIECGTPQGAHITFIAKENPFQRSVLSTVVLPYLKSEMNVSIYHKIEGGGLSGVRIPRDFQMKFMILGFVVPQLKIVLQTIDFAVPEMKSEGTELLKMANHLSDMVAESSETVKANPLGVLQGEKAQIFKNSINRLETQIASILTSSTKLSKKLLQYKANVQVPTIIAGIKSFNDNIQSVKSFRLDVMRSPVKQDLKGLVVGAVAQLCVGQLCIPDVKTLLIAVAKDTADSAIKNCFSSIDARYVKSQHSPLVFAFPLKKLKLGNIFFVRKDQSIIYSFSQQLMQINSTINLFGISKPIFLNVSNLHLNTKVKGKIFNKFKCSLNITADTTSVDGWEALVYKVNGNMEKDSALTRMLEKRLNNYALSLVERAEKRLKNAKTSLENATKGIQAARKALIISRRTLTSLEKKLSPLQIQLNVSKQTYQMAIIAFEDSLKDYNISSSNNKRCILTECRRICKKTCVQYVCQDRENVSYTVPDCRYQDSSIEKLMPKTHVRKIPYTTTPTVRKDVGKCTHFSTAFVEGFVKDVGLTSIIGKIVPMATQIKKVIGIAKKGFEIINNPQIIPEMLLGGLRKRVENSEIYNKINGHYEKFNDFRRKMHNMPDNIDQLRKQFDVRGLNWNIPLNDLPNVHNDKLLGGLGKRKKRSVPRENSTTYDRNTKVLLNVNRYLKSSNMTLKRDFDISHEMRKRIPHLPKNFDMSRALELYVTKQHHFNINTLLKEQFPALSQTYDINEELSMALPELKSQFNFNGILKKVVLKAVRLKSPINLMEELQRISPELQTNFETVLKRSSPQLKQLQNITEAIQDYLNNVVKFSLSPQNLQKFDVNSIMNANFRGLHRNFDVNKVVRHQVPQLSSKLNVNLFIINEVLGNGPNVGSLDEMIANASGVPELNLQKTLSKAFSGFKHQIDFANLFKNELKNMMTVHLNDSMLKYLTFSNIIKHNLPNFKDVDVDNILISAFPKLVNRINLHEILKGAAPLMKVLGDLDLNQVIMGVFKGLQNLDIDRVLKTRNPALRGSINIERFLSKCLKNVVLPNFDNVVMRERHGFSNISRFNVENVLENIIGKGGLEDLRNLVQTSVFFGFPENDVLDDESKEQRKRKKRFVLSGLVGGFLGAVQNSGCKTEYRNFVGSTETHEYEEKQVKLNPEKIPVKKWVCSGKVDKVNIVSDGYGRPYPCCKRDVPCVEFLDPVCVKKTQTCLNKRKIEFKIHQSLFNASFFEPQRNLAMAEKKVQDATLQLEKARIHKQVALQDFEIVKARLNQLLAMKNTSRIIYQKVKSVPEVDLGLKVKNILRHSLDIPPLRVVELSFNIISSLSSTKPRLPFKAIIKSRQQKDLTLYFVLDFENVELSLKNATHKAIRHLITPSRKRRSARIEFANFSSAPNKRHDGCLLSQNASLYFSDILKSLRKMLNSYDEQRSRVDNEIRALDVIKHTLDSSSNSQENSVSKEYSQVLSIYKDARRHQNDMTSWNESLVTWRNYVENITQIRQLPDCSGVLDCIEIVSELLLEKYKALENRNEVVKTQTLLLSLASGIKDLLADDELKRHQVKSKLGTLFVMLNATRDKNFLCMDKPIMKIQANAEVRVLSGENTTLHCSASSQSEILYTWRRDNDLLQTSKDGTLKLLDLQDANQGLYRCEARNHKGSTFSGITTITVESKPQILEHPVSSHVPLNSDSIVTFSCVASGKPTPVITWLYRPPSSSISMVLAGEDTHLLSVVPDDKRKSGYYYCEARSSRGMSVSREARLDVLAITVAIPKIALWYDVIRSCKSKVCQGNQAIPLQMDNVLEQNIENIIKDSLRLSSRKKISRLQYLPLSKSRAKMLLFVSTPLRNSQKDLSTDKILERFTEDRVKLIGKLKRLIHAMNRTILLTGNRSISLIGLVETLGFVHVEPDCPVGQWLHNEGYYCVKCPPGLYKDQIEGSCRHCPVGTYQPLSGQAACIPCGDDKTTQRKGSMDSKSCIMKVICPSGSYKEGVKGDCRRCPVGTFQPLSGQTACIPCGVNKTTLRNGTIDSTKCILKAVCPPGSFSTKENTCLMCPAKTYQPLAGKSSCISCTMGPELEKGRTTCDVIGPGMPLSLMVFTLSSSSIKVLWWKPKTGHVSHYELEYGYSGKSELKVVKIYPMSQSYHSGMQYAIRGLQKFTLYTVKVYAVFEKQKGKPAIKNFRTNADVPDASPKITSALPINSTAIEVKWQEVPIRARNGYILSNTIYFKENARAGFNSKKVGGKQLSTLLTRLKEDTRYCVKMTASTIIGAYRDWDGNPCYWVKTHKVIM